MRLNEFIINAISCFVSICTRFLAHRHRQNQTSALVVVMDHNRIFDYELRDCSANCFFFKGYDSGKLHRCSVPVVILQRWLDSEIPLPHEDSRIPAERLSAWSKNGPRKCSQCFCQKLKRGMTAYSKKSMTQREHEKKGQTQTRLITPDDRGAR